MQIKNRQQLLALLAGAAVAVFAADKIIITPLTHLWSSRSEKIAKLRKKLTDGNNLIRREQSLHSRWDTMRSNTLTNDQSLAEQQVLKAFDRWAQDSRITLANINSQWKHDGDEYKTLEYRVDATGNLETVRKFLYNIEKDPLALRLDMVEITAKDAEGQVLNLALQISGLVLTPQEKTK